MKPSRLLPVLALLATASTAMASDLPSKKGAPGAPAFTAFSWTGAYAGVDAGYLGGFSESRNTRLAPRPNVDPSMATLGAHIGYRYQFANNVVAGAELRGFGNLNSKTNGPGLNAASRSSVSNAWGGDARVTLGYAMDRALIYAAGGLAFAEQKGCFVITATFGCATGDGQARYSATRVGWTVGAGAAYAITNNWLARVEYSYSDLRTHRIPTYALSGLPAIVKITYQTHAVHAGLSYKF